MPKYVTRMAKSGESESYAVKDAGARELISTEVSNRTAAVSAEQSAREEADTAETEARQQAVSKVESELNSNVLRLAENDQNIIKNNNPFEHLSKLYLYKTNIYIASDGTEVINPTTDVYRIPLQKGEAVIIKYDVNNPFWGPASPSLVLKFLESDDSYTQIWGNGNDYYFRVDYEQCFAANMISDHKALSVLMYKGNENLMSFYKISLNNAKDDITHTALISEDTAIKSKVYWTPGAGHDGEASLIGTPFFTYLIKMRKGDQLHFNGHIPIVDYFCDEWKYTDRSYLRIYDRDYVAMDDVIVSVFGHPDVPKPCVYIPKCDHNEYNGKDGVAFGTSLTERGANNNGYLKYLPTISGTTIENAGDSGGTILKVDDASQWPCILDRILNYTNFSSKQFCILEGFVNDWNLNPDALGHYTDSGLTTVCGCVRAAINRIYSQNSKISLYLVLDHYGKRMDYSSFVSDISSTATRGESQITQYEYYEEIRKVAESLGVPVIREYTDGQISENTPEYLVDQIHCTDRGALQSARNILAGMKCHIPNT